MSVKKIIYIILFIFLGILVQFSIHGLIEIKYIDLLLKDFPKYSLGFSWQQWFLIHHIGTAILFLAGGLAGFFGGKFFWQTKYEKKS